MSYSPSLSYFLDRLSGYSTNYFKLQAQGSSSATANNIIRFNLPSNALLNMRTFALHFNATTDGTTAGARLPNKIDSLIERVEVSVGGVQLSAGANYYNVLCHAKQALMGDRSDPVLGHPEIVREKKYVDNDGTLLATTANETYVATNDSTQFCIDHWEGFLGSCEPKVLDSSLLADIVVSIYLASNNVLCSVGGVALTNAAGTTGFAGTAAGSQGNQAATYALNNIHATIECLGLADATYDNMVSQMIAQKGYVEVPFKQYISFRDNTSSAMRFSVAAACLDRIWVAHHMNGHAAQGNPVAVTGFKRAGAFVDATTGGVLADVDIGKPGFENFDMNQEKYIAKEFNFTEPPTNTKMRYQFQLNGALYPQFQASFEEMYEISKSSVLGAPQKAYPLSTLKDNYSVQCIRLNMPESEYSRLLSGLDLRGVSLNGFYNLHNANAARDITLFAECTSVLRIGSGKQLEVIQ